MSPDLTRTPDFHHPPFPSRRSVVMGTGGMVATSQPLAAQAGLHILRAGGTAFDAAVATAAALNVVEPTSTGIGGDVFCLGYDAATHSVFALNGSGRSPRALGREVFENLGGVPERGPLTVTVPGAVRAWDDLVRTRGRLALETVLEPAMALADHGFPVSELIAEGWERSTDLLAASDAGRRHYLPEGRAPHAGERVRLPGLARAFADIAAGGADAFYGGAAGDEIVATVVAASGALGKADLTEHGSTWPEPISTAFAGHLIWECPPNGQGLAALVALAVLREAPWPEPHFGTPGHVHPLIEALHMGFDAARRWVADPDFAAVPVAELLSAERARNWARRIDPTRAVARGTPLASGDDTVYLAVVDATGNACSFINSNYMGFGSGLVTPAFGIALQNRGAGFVLEPGHPNDYAPGKRPYHTIIPALATAQDSGRLRACFGVMGGFMQPQGHVQLLVNMLRYGMDPQRALDAPRVQILGDGQVALEPGFPEETRQALTAMGHRVCNAAETPVAGTFGGGQVVALDADGIRRGGSDPRKDGQVVAWE